MNILFYINTLGHGGAERVMANLANTFADSYAYDITLVTSKREETEYALSPNVKRVNLLDDYSGNAVVRNFKLLFELRALLKREKPDVAISFLPAPNYRLLLASVGLPVKKIVSVRNDPNREYPNFINKFIAKNLYNIADKVVFQTEDAQKWFPKLIQGKSVIIMNQVDNKFYNTERDTLTKDIVSVGRLTKQKNQRLLIEAFNDIRDKTEHNLIIYGDGEMREELEALVSELGLQERVLLPGNTDNVVDILKTAKLFVMPSDYEGMPNALLEAMAMGLPCISTDCPCGGPRMIIKDGENGVLVPTMDKDALVSAIINLINNEEKLNELGQKAKAAALAFSPSVIIKDWENCILSLVKKE